MKFRKKLYRALMVAFLFLTVFLVTVTAVLYMFENQVNDLLGIELSEAVGGTGDSVYFPSKYDNAGEVFKAKVEHERNVVAEATVLLKNENNALPITEKNAAVAVYYTGTQDTDEDGGFGTFTQFGEYNFAYATNGPGATFTSFADNHLVTSAISFTEALKYNGLNVTTVVKSKGDTAASGMKAAFVVVSRTRGEQRDLTSAGALELTADEKATLQMAKSSGAEKVILVLSGDHALAIDAYKKDADIDAIIKVGNVGHRGAYGLADVITGVVSPSGKLTDMYPVSAESAPANVNFGNFSYTNSSAITARQAGQYVVYSEGIYVDYRYYETRYNDTVLGKGNADSTAGAVVSTEGWNYDQEVSYTFGYGGSYTTFKQEFVGAPTFNTAEKTATVKVKITNTGDYDGKDVVAIYGQAPYEHGVTKVEKSAIQLLAFEKTEKLTKNGGNQEVTVTVPMQWLASYDYKDAKTYIMDAGDYYFALGNGAHEALNNVLKAQGKDVDGNASMTYTWHQDALDKTTYATSAYTDKTITNIFDDVDVNYWYDNDVVTYLSRSDWNGTYPQPVQLEASQKMISFLNEAAGRYKSGTIDNKEKAAQKAKDGLTYNKDDKATGVMDIVTLRGKDYEDPAWNEVLNSLTMSEMVTIINGGYFYVKAASSVNFPGSEGSDNPIGLNRKYLYSTINKKTNETKPLGRSYVVKDQFSGKECDLAKVSSTMYPSEPTYAATFNKALAYEEGELWAEDGLYSNMEFCWGLGANMHRSAKGGRVSEYYSADGVLTSLIGAAMSKGAWDNGFVQVTKHFATNDQETNRSGSASLMNEQALREIYLRAFEGIMTYGECKGVMGTYNRIGLQSSDEEYDLMTTLLREEWGSICYVITDLCGETPGLYDGMAMLVAGTDIMMTSGGGYSDLAAADISGDKVALNAARNAMHNLLYIYTNSAAMNGISVGTQIIVKTPWWKPFSISMDVIFGILAVAATVMYILTYNFGNKGDKENV